MGLWLLVAVHDTPRRPILSQSDAVVAMITRAWWTASPIAPNPRPHLHGIGRAGKAEMDQGLGIIRRPNPYLPGWQINASISSISVPFAQIYGLTLAACCPTTPSRHHSSSSTGPLTGGAVPWEREWRQTTTLRPRSIRALTSPTADTKHRANLFQGHPYF